MIIRAPHEDELEDLRARLREEWMGEVIVSRGVSHQISNLAMLVAVDGSSPAGLASYFVGEGGCELVTLNAFEPGRGVGGALLEAVAKRAREAGCDRLWLVTTNDNEAAQRFYEHRGLRLVATHHGAVDEARALKPSIPFLGENGIEIHNELEYELKLGRWDSNPQPLD